MWVLFLLLEAWGLQDFPAPRGSELVSRQGSLFRAHADTALLDLFFLSP